MKIITNNSGIYFNGTKEEQDSYLNHLTTGKRLHVTHYEDEARNRQIQAMIDSEVEGDFTGASEGDR